MYKPGEPSCSKEDILVHSLSRHPHTACTLVKFLFESRSDFAFTQTTYENFRYRYDKKENPYNKGIMGNCGETFCSTIPPSMNKFRSFVVEDEQMMVRSVTPELGEGAMSSKEKIDIEMGTRLPEDSAFPLPVILRDLDYDELEKNMEEERRRGLDSFLPVETETKESAGGNGRIEPVQSLTMDGGDRDPVQHSPARERVRESIESTIVMDGTLERNDDRSNSRRTMVTQA